MKKKTRRRHSSKSTRKRRRHNRHTRPVTKRVNGRLLLLSVVIWLIISIGISSFFYSISRVRGYGMIPTLSHNSLVLVNKKRSINRFDIVKVRMKGEKPIFLRVIGMPEEEITYKDDYLFINGEERDEKFLIDEINLAHKDGGIYTEDFTTKDWEGLTSGTSNNYLLLGDNRPNSNDSRFYGFFSEDQLEGVVIKQLYPLNKGE